MRAWFSGGVLDGYEFDVPDGTLSIRVTLDAFGDRDPGLLGSVSQAVERYEADPNTDGGFRTVRP